MVGRFPAVPAPYRGCVVRDTQMHIGFVHVYICAYTHITFTYMNTHTPIYIYIYIYIYTDNLGLRLSLQLRCLRIAGFAAACGFRNARSAAAQRPGVAESNHMESSEHLVNCKGPRKCWFFQNGKPVTDWLVLVATAGLGYTRSNVQVQRHMVGYLQAERRFTSNEK